MNPLRLMPREWVIPCILHCTMVIGRVQQNFGRKDVEGLFAADKVRIEGDLADHKTGCSIATLGVRTGRS